MSTVIRILGICPFWASWKCIAAWRHCDASSASGRIERGKTTLEPARELGKLFIVMGVLFIAAGLLQVFGAKLPLHLGRLPGDIAYKGRHGDIYFPIVTWILVSAALTLILWVVNHFRR